MSKIKKILPWILIFHPRGPFKKWGPYVGLFLFTLCLPIIFSQNARDKIFQSPAQTQQSAQSQNQASSQPSPQTPQRDGFNMYALTGAWTLRTTDAERGDWSWAQTRANSAKIWESQIQGEGVYEDFYCGCSISRRGDSSGDVDLQSCGYEARNMARAERLEWEHIVPASKIGANRICWTQGLPQCINSNGQPYKGRSCCENADPEYAIIANDPVNLVPSVGEVNGVRSNLPFAEIRGRADREFGQCQTRIDTTVGVVEPDDDRKGDVARVISYMSRAYGITIPRQDAETYTRWMSQDPVSEEEIRINQAIRDSGHRANPLVLGE